MGGNVLRQILDTAINGGSKIPGAKTVAAKYLVKKGNVESAIDDLITSHVRLATAQGFITNVAGGLASVVGLPANIAALATVQIRLIAAIAHLRGYDVDDARVRTAMTLCLLGEHGVTQAIQHDEVPTTPLAIATAPMFDAELDRRIAEKVFTSIGGRISGRGVVVFLARKVPLVGGGVSGVMDAWHTSSVGSYASDQFPTRRRLTR